MLSDSERGEDAEKKRSQCLSVRHFGLRSFHLTVLTQVVHFPTSSFIRGVPITLYLW